MVDEIHLRTLADVPAYCQAMADALAAGREFGVWHLDHDGTEALAYTLRLDDGVIRVRNGDLSDIGVFSDIGAAVRFGQEQAPFKVPVPEALS